MISPYWSNEDTLVDAVKAAKERGVPSYASYSYNEGDYSHPGDVDKTITFVKEKLAGLLDAEPWHLPAVYGHESAVWDVATFDGDGDGRADIWETILGETNAHTATESITEGVEQEQEQAETESGAEELNIPTTILQEDIFGEAPIKEMLAQKFLKHEETPNTYKRDKSNSGALNSAAIVNKYYVYAPENLEKIEHVIAYLPGAEASTDTTQLIKTMADSELKIPDNTIVVELKTPRTDNVWGGPTTIKDSKGVLEEVYSDFDLKYEEVQGIAIRI